MDRLRCFVCAGVLLALLPRSVPASQIASSVAPAPAAERLLELHLAWRGGREALEALTFLERRGDIRIGANEGTFRAVGARDGHLRYDVKLEGVQQVEAVTPHGGWRWVNGDLADLSSERIVSFRTSIDEMFGRHLLLDGGYRARSLGTESVDGIEYEVLRVAHDDGRIDLYLDPDDGSLHWTREPEGDDVAWTRLDDWRLVDGVRFAFRADRNPDGGGRRQLTEWKEVVTRGAIDPAEFLRPPAGSGRLELDGDGVSLPFELFLDAYIELDGAVAGHEASVMLDSGAGITVLDRTFAERIGLPLRRAGRIRGMGGEERLYLARDVDIELPGVALRGATVGVLDLSEIADVMGRRFEVILGVEVFTRAVVTIDYPARRVSFESPHPYEPPPGAHSARMLSRGGTPTVRCRYEELPETLCAIDTGSNSSVDIVAHYVDAYDMLDGRAPVSRIATGGVGGMLEAPISTLRRFTFAGYSVGSVPASFMAEAVGSLDTDEIAGNIGAALLRPLVAVFDYPGMRVHLLAPAEDVPVRRDRTGVQSTYRGDHLQVFYVAPGSPAAAAGLRAGERITAIDGRRIGHEYLDERFRWRFAPAGTEVVLTDDLGRDYRLVLADYY